MREWAERESSEAPTIPIWLTKHRLSFCHGVGFSIEFCKVDIFLPLAGTVKDAAFEKKKHTQSANEWEDLSLFLNSLFLALFFHALAPPLHFIPSNQLGSFVFFYV